MIGWVCGLIYRCIRIERVISHINVQLFPTVQYLPPAKVYALEEFNRFGVPQTILPRKPILRECIPSATLGAKHLFSVPLKAVLFFGLSFPVTGVSPESVPLSWSSEIVVTGSMFSPSKFLSCFFRIQEGIKGTSGAGVTSHLVSKGRFISTEAVACSTEALANRSSSPSSLPKALVVQVSVSNTGVETADSWTTLTVSDTPILEGVLPAAGPTTGGTSVAISGQGFLDSPGLSCAFGAMTTPGIFVNSSRITCQTPPLRVLEKGEFSGDMAKLIWITVSNNGIQFSTLGLDFLYMPPVEIFSISPRVVSLEDVMTGHAVASISGKGFTPNFDVTERSGGASGVSIGAASNITCRFNGIGDSLAIVVRSTLITCPLPVAPASEGVVRVTVSINRNDFPPADHGVTLALVEAPRIASVFPVMGPSSGGTLLHILGEHIDIVDPLICNFQFEKGLNNGTSTKSVTAEYDGKGRLSCVTPPAQPVRASGTSTDELNVMAVVSVAAALPSLPVSGSLYETNVSGLEFTYFATPRVTGLYPPTGTPGTRVDISGEGFIDNPGLACRFGDITVVPIVFKTSNAITCKAPVHANDRAVVNVEVSNNIVDWTSNGLTFVYRPHSSINSITPKVGPVHGSTIVRVTGSAFPVGNATEVDSPIHCRFGRKFVAATQIGEAQLSCVSPATDFPESVNLELTVEGMDITDSGWRFDYVPEVEVSNVHPLQGPEVGGTEVMVTGPAFSGLEVVFCQFGAPSSRTTGRWLSRTTFACETLPQKPGSVELAISINGQQFTKTGLTFSFQPLASVRSISPPRGSVNGGTVVTIEGAGFVNTVELACLVGERLGDATYINPTMVECRVPAAATQERGSLAAVRIANNGVDFTESLGILYEYVPQLDVLRIEPTIGSTEGRTMLQIDGRGFRTAANISCVVDGLAVETTVESSDFLTCVAPKVESPRTVEVTLTNNGADTSHSSVLFRYHSPVEVISVYPTSAPEDGGSKLLLTGSEFMDTAGLACVFSSSRDGFWAKTSAVFISDRLLSCRSPSGRVGQTDLRVTNNGIELSPSLVSFSLTSSSTVTVLWPSSGSIYGKTSVRVQGTAFIDSPSTFCRFGDKVVSVDVVLDGTTIFCTSPSREEPGQVAVEVTSNGQDWGISSATFTYVLPLEIKGAAPNIGPLTGGTAVRISGSGFSASADGAKLSCRFSRAVVVAAVVMDPTTAICVAPASPRLGLSSLEISTNGVDFTSDGWVFHYVPDISVTSVWPLVGPESGGTTLTIVGTGFTGIGVFMCEFGSMGTIVPASRMGSTTLSCLCPPHMPGKVPIRLSMNGQQFTETGVMFEYLMEATVQSVTPSFGPSHGGTLVEVEGKGFANSSALSCRLARRRLPAVFLDSGHIQCATPSSTTYESMPLEVSINGADFTSSGVLFTFVAPIVVRHAWPMNGPISGGTSVVVYGSGFSGGGTLHCIFGGKAILATVRSDDELYCVSPPSDSAGRVPLELTSNMLDRVASPRNFAYVAPIALASVRPSRSGEEGGVTAVVTGTNFNASPSLVCRFGGLDPAQATWLSSSRVSCLVPPSSGGPREVSLTISNNGQDFAAEPLVFTYIPAFTVVSNEPTTGPVEGGTSVILSGTELGEVGPWACIFGQIAVTAVQVANGYLQCQSPPQPAGKIPLRVFRSSSPLAPAVPGAIAAVASNSLRDFGLHFEYQGTVYISSIQPRSGSITGGTPVTLLGFGFSNTTRLTCGFGESDRQLLTTPALYVAAEMVLCSSPPYLLSTERVVPLAPTFVSVTLSLNGVDFADHGPQFMYYAPVDVTRLFPGVGSVHGGTVLTVVGRNFLPSEGLSCRFGSFSASPAEFLSSELIRCTAPPSLEGPTKVAVTASNNLEEFSWTSAEFEYRPPARPARFNPPAGPISGGTLLEIEGSAFSATSQLACRIGGVTVSAALVSPSKMTCRTPASLVEKQARVEVSVNGADWEDIGDPSHRGVFIYYQPPELVKLDPSTGPQVGGTHLSVFGYHLAPVLANSSVLCRFGNRSTALKHVSAALASDSSRADMVEEVATCKVPDLGADVFSRVEVSLSTDGGAHFSAPALIFTYVQVRVY